MVSETSDICILQHKIQHLVSETDNICSRQNNVQDLASGICYLDYL